MSGGRNWYGGEYKLNGGTTVSTRFQCEQSSCLIVLESKPGKKSFFSSTKGFQIRYYEMEEGPPTRLDLNFLKWLGLAVAAICLIYYFAKRL